jgi:hypothetical protein
MNKDRGVDAAIQCDTFENDSMVAPPLRMISPLIEAYSRFAIYFQNVNRLRTEDDYDVIVLLEMGLVSSCHDEELFDARFFGFQM